MSDIRKKGTKLIVDTIYSASDTICDMDFKHKCG